MQFIVFDVGETLVDESRLWGLWAAWLGVRRDIFERALVDVIRSGRHHRAVFERFKPGFDLEDERRKRISDGWPTDVCGAQDLYSDALPCLRELKAQGYGIGVAGNQPADILTVIAGLGIDFDLIASSASWRVEKPSAAFFKRMVAELEAPPAEIMYVGDRVDNDVLPAHACGLRTALLRRGPWGEAQEGDPRAETADLRIQTLLELPERLRSLG